MKDTFNMKLSNEIPPIQVNDDTGVNKVVYSDSEKIEVLNAYFSSISDIDDNNVTLPHMYSLCNDSLDNIVVEEQEVSDIITILPVNKAVGPDSISHKMLKSTKKTIAKPLTMLFNRSLSENMFPYSWKIAHVIPLFRKEDPSKHLIKGLFHYYHVLVRLWRESFLNTYITIFIVMIYSIDIKLDFYQDTPQSISY